MKPIKLTLTAFGPFANETVIDFETDLANQQIFVISGPTGAGKTTIFDAICYALYGETSGKARKGKVLRSDFATAKSILTEVEFIFSVKEKTYVITRRPQQEIPHKKKEGAVVKKSAAQSFYEIENKEEILEKEKEITEKVQEVIGLSADQFRKIVMIPQGDFKEFLMASTKDKEVLLRKIFGTDLCEQIQQALSEKEKQLRGTAEILGIEMDAKLKSFNCLDSEELSVQIQAQIPNSEKIKLCEQHLMLMEDDIKMNQTNLQALDTKLVEIEATYHRAIKTERQFEELDHVKLALDDLVSNTTKMLNLKQTLIELEAAQSIYQYDKIKKEKIKAYEHYTHQKNKVELELSSIEEKLVAMNEMLQEVPKFEQQLTKIKEEQHELVLLSKDLALLETQKQCIQTLEPQIENLKGQVAHLLTEKEQLSQSQQPLEVLYKRLSNQTQVVHQHSTELESLSNQLRNLNKIYRILCEQQVVNEMIIKKGKNLEQAKQLLQEQKQKHDLLYQASINGAAANLAIHLKKDTPCPVCGSHDHPNIATTTTDVPTKTDLTHANQHVEQAQQQLQELEKELIAHHQTIQTQQEYLIDLVSQAKLSDEILKTDVINLRIKMLEEATAQQTNQYKHAQLLEKQYKQTIEDVLRIEKELVEVTKQQIEKSDELTQLLTKLDVEKRSHDDLLKRIPNQYQCLSILMQQKEKLTQESITISKKVQQIKMMHEEYTEQKAQNLATHQTLINVLKTQHKEMQEAINLFDEKVSQVFTSVEQYQGCLKDETRIEDLVKELKSYDEQLYAKKMREAELQQVLKNVKREDVKSYEDQLNDLKMVKEQLNHTIVKCLTVQRHNKSLLSDVKQAQAANYKVEQEYQLIGDLEKLANGKLGNKMTFETYVLISYFEDVLYFANQRLLKMTNRRYELRRREDVSGGGRKGLELDVYDGHTAKTRPVSTLSGGESFKASLSLALGLSDTVMHNAGGVSLDTMFIDEGFGTLDSDSLEQAIEILIELQNNGRLIGVISHVEELKQRISAKLMVEALPTGSIAYFKK